MWGAWHPKEPSPPERLSHDCCLKLCISAPIQHPCRTRSMTADSPIVIANVMHRALDNGVLEDSFRSIYMHIPYQRK